MRTVAVPGNFFRLIIASVLSTLLITSCGSSSSFSGGNEKPAGKKTETAKKADATPVKPITEDKDDENVEEKKPDLNEDTVEPEILDDDIKLPEDAIVKGSFRVWTIPADPEPLEDYKIHIDIKIPSNATNYTKEDLSGQVIGTDGYQQPIGRDADFLGEVTQRFEAFPGRATLVISVPGALNLVKDTINIKSTLLNEAQNIEIIF